MGLAVTSVVIDEAYKDVQNQGRFDVNQIRKASRALQAPYDELVSQLPNEESIHIDETGGKENGDLRWIEDLHIQLQ